MARIRTFTAAIAATLSLLFAGSSLAAVQMLSPASPLDAGPAPKAGKSLVPVHFHAEEIFRLAPGTEVDLPLPNGNKQSYVFERAIDHGGGIRTWIGKSSALDGGHRAVITTSLAGTWGWMSSQYGQFRLYPGDGSDWLGQAPQRDLSPKFAGGDAISGPPDAPALAPLKGIPTSAPASLAFGSMAKTLTDVKQVDVMFVYSRDLAQKLGAGLMPMMLNVIASANQAYADSQVAFTLRLVNATMLDVSNTSASDDVLDAMNNANAAAHASLNTMFRDITWSSGSGTSIRDRNGADVVALLRDGPDDTGGIGFLLKNPAPYVLHGAGVVVQSYAYSVSNYCASGCEGIVTHEIGHNMGDHHDRATVIYDSASHTLDESGVFSYSYGMYSCNGVNTGFTVLTCNPTGGGCVGHARPTCTPSSPNDFGTVMSYFSPQLLRFSNPSQVDCHAAGGVSTACGVAGQDDNAQSMNTVRNNVSAYRNEVIVGGLPGSLQFDNIFYGGSEAGGSIVFHVSRVNGSSGAVNVQYTAASGSATAGTDFGVTGGTLSWADGDASTKSITIPLVNDGFNEGNETFTVTLSNPTGVTGVYVGYPSAATGIITEPFPTGVVGTLPIGFASGSGSSVSWGIANDSSADGDGSSLKSGLMNFAVKACTDPVYGSIPCPSIMQYVGALGAGSLGFAYKVSAYPGYGFLEFYVDGTLLLQAAGSSANTSADSGWQYFSTPVTAGTHTLAWRYRSGLPFACAGAYVAPSPPLYPGCADRAWVDELTLPFVIAASTASLSSNANPSSTGQAVTFTASVTSASGTPSGSIAFNDGGSPIGGCTSVPLVSGVAACTTSALAAGVHSVTAVYGGSASYSGATSAVLMQAVSAGPLLLSAAPAPLDFGGQSMNTTTPAMNVVITNTSGSAVTPTSITASSGYTIAANGCTAAIAPAANCTISLTFTPAAQGMVSGLLTVSYASGGPTYAALTGVGERSLVTHYYRSILRRAPDTAGHDFWESEATRVTGLGANVNETWYALAMSFFNSQEYANFHTDNAGYLNDLYLTFFNRAPDSGGFAFWLDQMSQGMPRDAVLASFMFSPEFKNFTEAIFGTSGVRAEIDMSMDMYRGTLARLPDSAGFNFYLGQFRTAQCQGANTVRTQASTVSTGFLDSAEYANRHRTNAQYMSDLYNTFMRRGPDLAGINFYIGQLDSGAQTRQQLRAQFLASLEFTNRVTNVVNAGCAP